MATSVTSVHDSPDLKPTSPPRHQACPAPIHDQAPFPPQKEAQPQATVAQRATSRVHFPAKLAPADPDWKACKHQAPPAHLVPKEATIVACSVAGGGGGWHEWTPQTVPECQALPGFYRGRTALPVLVLARHLMGKKKLDSKYRSLSCGHAIKVIQKSKAAIFILITSLFLCSHSSYPFFPLLHFFIFFLLFSTRAYLLSVSGFFWPDGGRILVMGWWVMGLVRRSGSIAKYLIQPLVASRIGEAWEGDMTKANWRLFSPHI